MLWIKLLFIVTELIYFLIALSISWTRFTACDSLISLDIIRIGVIVIIRGNNKLPNFSNMNVSTSLSHKIFYAQWCG